MRGLAYIWFLLAVTWTTLGFAQTTNQTPREQVLGHLQGVYSTNQTAAVQKIKAMGTNAVPTLIEVLGYRQQALDEWYEKVYLITPAAMQKHLSKPDVIAKLRERASFTLQMMPETGNYLQDLLPLLKDERLEVRKAVAAIFAGGNRRASPAVMLELMPLLKDDDGEVRKYAIWALKFHITTLPRAKAAMEGALLDPDEDVRVAASGALLQADNSHPGAMAVVRASMKSTNNWAQKNAVSAYLSAQKDSPGLDHETGPLVTGMLLSTDPQSQAFGLMLLQANGKSLISTVPEVQKLLTNSTPYIRREATNALRALTNSVPKP